MLDKDIQKLGESLGLCSEYVSQILKLRSSGLIKVVLVGLDLYSVKEQDGDWKQTIPFCTKSWKDVSKSGYGGSGYYLFRSVSGYEITCLKSSFKSPNELAIALAKSGVILLNAYYKDYQSCSDEDKQNSLEFNKLFIDTKNKHFDVFILGHDAFDSFDEAQDLMGELFFSKIIHPSPHNASRNRHSRYWGKGILKNLCDIEFELDDHV